MNELNKLFKRKKMTKKEQALLEILRSKIKNEEITKSQARKCWDENVLHKTHPDWWYES